MSQPSQGTARFPSFFIVGAPRCGTTALSSYLARNPQVCFSKPKEPHYFSMLFGQQPGGDLQTDYVERFFGHCTGAHRAIGEGSVSYLYHPEAIQNILEENPEARFIVMVRNPVDLIYSYHARLLAVLEEDQEDFATAWSLQAERAQGRRLPKRCHDPSLLQYTRVGMLAKHLASLFEQVGRERCLVVVHDDFVQDTLSVYQQVLAFIGAEYDGRVDFPRKEANKYIHSRWLQRLLKRPPGKMMNWVRTMEQQQKRKGRKKTRLMRMRKWLLKRNKLETKRPSLPPEMRHLLRDTFAEDIARLGHLLQRDLSHWV